MSTMQPHRTTGWHPDPMHELVDGRPVVLRWWDGHAWTQNVRRWDGHAWIDEGPALPDEPTGPRIPDAERLAGAQALPTTPETRHDDASAWTSLIAPTHAVPAGTSRASRRTLLLVIAGLVVLAGAAVAAVLFLLPDAEQHYLEELRAAGLGGQYSSDANAIASGEAACTRMRSGAPQSGTEGDQIAVKHFCPEFADGFHVLKEITVDGTFTLLDSRYYSTGISASGGSCEGASGYNDISAGTPVVLRSGEGKVLASTTLGTGSGDVFECTFSFSLPVTEGESDYVVTVADRGEMHYTFTQLELDGIGLTLGD